MDEWLKNLTGEVGCSVLMATHDLAVVKSRHAHVVVLLEGRIAAECNLH